MQYRHLGKSGIQLSAISIGGWLNFGSWIDDDEAIKLIHQAFSAGINLFDVADVYANGQAETVLGKALKELPREQVVVATKCRGRVWPGPMGEGLSRKHIIEACHASLKRLDIDYIDLYQIHDPDPNTPIEETIAALNLLVHQGKILYPGYSNFSPEDLENAQTGINASNRTGFISNQTQYNLLWRVSERKLFPACQKLGIGILGCSPLAEGVLTGKYHDGMTPAGSRQTHDYDIPLLNEDNLAIVEKLRALAEQFGITMAQLALSWCLRRKEVVSVIIGVTSPEQLDENLVAGNQLLDDEQLKAIDDILAK